MAFERERQRAIQHWLLKQRRSGRNGPRLVRSGNGREHRREEKSRHALFVFRHREKRSPRFYYAAVAILLFIIVLASVPFTVTAAIAEGASYAYSYFVSGLPSLDQMHTLSFETTKIYDRNGVLLYEIYDPNAGKRTKVSLEEISPWVPKATIATEDANFYTNPGVDINGIIRAVYINISGAGQSGGSTITQQLVRQVLLSNEKNQRTYTRKIREALLALELSSKYSKDQILEMYLNEVYYGHLAYGIEAASQTYFGKLSKNLDLAESALLAGLPQAPSAYDPTKNLPLAKQRQGAVLGLMAKAGYISEEQAKEAYDEPLQFVKQTQEKILAPHFVRYVQQLLEEKYGPDLVNRGGLSVFTSIDMRYQTLAEKIAKDHIATLASSNVHNAALVAMKPKTGEILAMVGSVDYYDESIDGQVNVAISPRQPGSSFKPIAYATAFKKGWSPGTTVSDSYFRINMEGGPPYAPKNYDLRYHGTMTLRSALANSYNIPAVKVLLYAGLHDTIQTAHDMGITGLQDESRYGPALVLGGGEVTLLDLTAAYATFANGGVANKPVAILKVLDANGKVIDQFDPNHPQSKRVLQDDVAYLITSILSDNKARAPMFGLNSPLQLSVPVAAKTGTTTDYRDGWTMGYTPYLAVGVWAGNSNNEAMLGEPGVRAAAPIWHNFIEGVMADRQLQEVLKDAPGKPLQMDFRRPAGVMDQVVCSETGQLPTRYCPLTSKDIVAKSAIRGYCTLHTPYGGKRSPLWSSMVSWPDIENTLAATIAVTPTAGEKAQSKDMVRVPDVQGMTEAKAKSALWQAGLSVAPVNYVSEDNATPGMNVNAVKPGCVLSSMPDAGTPAPRNGLVFLTVRRR